MNQSIVWFFKIFAKEFREGKRVAFEMMMLLACAHFFGFQNPKQLADYLGVPHHQFYRTIKEFSLYSLKEMLICFMVSQVVEQLKEALKKSEATKSRAGITLSTDNSVIDRVGKMFRCTWSWYSGRCKKVVNGNDLMGLVLSINGMAFPLHLVFCSKQGRGNTTKPSLLISMLKRLKTEFEKHAIKLENFPITLDSWFVSEGLRKELSDLGFTKIVIAGKGNYSFEIDGKTQKASKWKQEIELEDKKWGIDVPSKRVRAKNKTFGSVVLFFFQKSTTRSYYLMNFGSNILRGAEIWHIWKHHHVIECFWKVLKSVLGIKSMQLQGDGLYASLLIKVLAYGIFVRTQLQKEFLKLSITQVMRKVRRELDITDLLNEHFHLDISRGYETERLLKS
jgi:hypothetical protein